VGVSADLQLDSATAASCKSALNLGLTDNRAKSAVGNRFMAKVGKFFLGKMPTAVSEKTRKVAHSYGWRGQRSVLSYATWDDLQIRNEDGKLKEDQGNVTFVMRPEFVVAALAMK